MPIPENIHDILGKGIDNFTVDDYHVITKSHAYGAILSLMRVGKTSAPEYQHQGPLSAEGIDNTIAIAKKHVLPDGGLEIITSPCKVAHETLDLYCKNISGSAKKLNGFRESLIGPYRLLQETWQKAQIVLSKDGPEAYIEFFRNPSNIFVAGIKMGEEPDTFEILGEKYEGISCNILGSRVGNIGDDSVRFREYRIIGHEIGLEAFAIRLLERAGLKNGIFGKTEGLAAMLPSESFSVFLLTDDKNFGRINTSIISYNKLCLEFNGNILTGNLQ